jgi:hypothetical protein
MTALRRLDLLPVVTFNLSHRLTEANLTRGGGFRGRRSSSPDFNPGLALQALEGINRLPAYGVLLALCCLPRLTKSADNP